MIISQILRHVIRKHIVSSQQNNIGIKLGKWEALHLWSLCINCYLINEQICQYFYFQLVVSTESSIKQLKDWNLTAMGHQIISRQVNSRSTNKQYIKISYYIYHAFYSLRTWTRLLPQYNLSRWNRPIDSGFQHKQVLKCQKCLSTKIPSFSSHHSTQLSMTYL